MTLTPDLQTALFSLAGGVAIVLHVWLLSRLLIKHAHSHQLLMVTGGKRGTMYVIGGSIWVNPLLHRTRVLTLPLIHVAVDGTCPSSAYTPITYSASAYLTVCLQPDALPHAIPILMQSAAERDTLLRSIIEAHLRDVIAHHAPIQTTFALYIASKGRHQATAEMQRMGFEIQHIVLRLSSPSLEHADDDLAKNHPDDDDTESTLRPHDFQAKLAATTHVRADHLQGGEA